MNELRLLSLCGMLGYGYPEASLRRGIESGAAVLGADAGSTDPGPYYLGNGTGFVQPLQVRRDLELALVAARAARIPLLIGSAGGAGARPHLDAFLEILRDIARRRGLRFRMAVIPSDIPTHVVENALKTGAIHPCGPVPALTADTVRACTRIVAQMSTGPLIRALDAGAEVVIAGRCCDTAIFAAPAIRAGFDPGLALHLGKIAECGALCARPAGANDGLLGVLRRDHFIVEPVNPVRRCTPDSVAAHSLYEQPDPDCFYEPEGKVDLTGCRFEPEGERGVRVSGTRLVPPERLTVKLEGVVRKGYRTVTIAGIRDPILISHLDEIEKGVREAITANLASTLPPSEWSLRFIRYGLDGVMGPLETAPERPPREVGLLIEAVAPTQELADTVLSLARSTTLHQHFTARKTTAGNLAFPFSPSDLHGGAVYEFAIYHLMDVTDLDALFPVTFEEV